MVWVESDGERQGENKMSDLELDTITHVEFMGTRVNDKNLLLFQRVNALQAGFCIIESEHYLELIRAAAEGRFTKKSMEESGKILLEIFDKCEGASDAYLKIVKKMGEA